MWTATALYNILIGKPVQTKKKRSENGEWSSQTLSKGVSFRKTASTDPQGITQTKFEGDQRWVFIAVSMAKHPQGVRTFERETGGKKGNRGDKKKKREEPV